MKIILKAFSVMSDVGQAVMRSASDAPIVLQEAETFVSIYPWDAALNDKVIQLYVALITMLGACIAWYDHGFSKSSEVPFLALADVHRGSNEGSCPR
jgi:hypothetical protein